MSEQTASQTVTELQRACTAWLNADEEVASADGQRAYLRARLSEAKRWVAEAEALEVAGQREADYREMWGMVCRHIGHRRPTQENITKACSYVCAGTAVDPTKLYEWAVANNLTTRER